MARNKHAYEQLKSQLNKSSKMQINKMPRQKNQLFNQQQGNIRKLKIEGICYLNQQTTGKTTESHTRTENPQTDKIISQ